MQPGDTFFHWDKVDLHRDLEGSLRLSTLHAIAQEHALLRMENASELESLVRVDPSDPHRPDFFLSKLDSIRKHFIDQAAIERFSREVIEDAAADQVRYLELCFAPAALASRGNFPLEAVCEWVISAASAEAETQAVDVRYLLSFDQHEPVAVAREVTELAIALHPRGVVGLDLTNDQRYPAATPPAGMLRHAHDQGLGIAVHASGWGSGKLTAAIRELGATRIAHGVHILEDQDLLREAREAEVCFEVGLTSDLRTGALQDLASHPLPGMLEAGLQIALTTDDPAIFNITLSDEYRLAMDVLGLSLETLKGMTLSALQSSFLDPKSKRLLERHFVAQFWGKEG
jgi:adenosine deaminase